MQYLTYPCTWHGDEGDRLQGRFLRLEHAVTAPKSGKVPDVLTLLEVESQKRSLWLWTVALKGLAEFLAQAEISSSETVRVEHVGRTMLDKEEGCNGREYRFAGNREDLAV